MRREGLRPIAPFEGSQLLGLSLGLQSPYTLCAGINWDTLARRRPRSRWFFSDFISAGHNGASRLPSPKANLTILDRKGRATAVLNQLSIITASVTHADLNALSRNTVLARVGVDSLMAVEIQGKVAAEMGVDIAVAELLADLSLWNLAERVASRIA